MKLGTMNARLATSLTEADLVFGYSEQAGKNIPDWDLAAALAPPGTEKTKTRTETETRIRTFENLDELLNALCAAAHPGDHILVMSNGGFGGIHQKLIHMLS